MSICSRCLQPNKTFRERHGQCTDCEAATESERYAKRVAEQDASKIDAFKLGGSTLIAFGLPLQQQAAEALLAKGSVLEAAEDLGIEPARLRALLSELQRRAARSGYSPAHDMSKSVPAGFHVKGVSTFYGKDGEVKGQWVKSNKDEEHKILALLDAMSHVADAWQNKSTIVESPALVNDDLLCVYPMGDPHFGMFSWGEETGADFDLKIAERTLCAAVDQLVALAPPAREAIVLTVGDTSHGDNTSNVTARSGNVLDVDTRYGKVMRVIIRSFRRCIDRALEKHELVKVIIEFGNHDDNTAMLLALCLAQFYENNPRVTVDTSPSPFHWHRFGANLIGVTHGHMTKPADLPGIMACDRKEDWGTTDHRHWYTGHIHHDTVKEFPGCTVETLRTLATRDAWHHAKGYRSGQDMKCDVWHRQYGRVQRNTVGISRLKEI